MNGECEWKASMEPRVLTRAETYSETFMGAFLSRSNWRSIQLSVGPNSLAAARLSVLTVISGFTIVPFGDLAFDGVDQSIESLIGGAPGLTQLIQSLIGDASGFRYGFC